MPFSTTKECGRGDGCWGGCWGGWCCCLCACELYRDPWALFRLDEDVVVTDGDTVKATNGYDEEERVVPSIVVDAVDEDVVVVTIEDVVVVSDDGAPPPFVKCKFAAVCKYYKKFCIFNCRKAPLDCEVAAIYFVINLIL